MKPLPEVRAAAAETSSMQVIYEDNHLLVISKPAGLATMGALPGIPTALELARNDIAHRYRKPGAVYLGVVSRLDSAVTGVLIFARTSKAAARLSAQFRERLIRKTYIALTSRTPQKSAERVDCWLRRDDDRHLTVPAAANSAGAQHSSLDYRLLGQGDGKSLLEITPHTGRKHQIRAQLQALKIPIVGDRKYGSDTTFPSGIALHALSLQFKHPVLPELLHISAPPPSPWPTWTSDLLKDIYPKDAVRRLPLPD
jgi:23S rRNA pseudouridine1911/1915/1917 synthase